MLINQQPATIFNGLFTFCPNILNYQAVSSSTGKIFKPSYRTDCYGKIQLLVPLIVAIKLDIILVVCYWKQILQLKSKVYLMTNTYSYYIFWGDFLSTFIIKLISRYITAILFFVLLI